MPSVGSSHHLPGAIAFNFAGSIARWTLDIVALMGDVTVLEPYRGRCGNYRAVGCRLIARQNQISSHFPWDPVVLLRLRRRCDLIMPRDQYTMGQFTQEPIDRSRSVDAGFRDPAGNGWKMIEAPKDKG